MRVSYIVSEGEKKERRKREEASLESMLNYINYRLPKGRDSILFTFRSRNLYSQHFVALQSSRGRGVLNTYRILESLLEEIVS